MAKVRIYLFLVVGLFVAAGISSSHILRAWNEPTSTAPNNNIEAPLNTVEHDVNLIQSKKGFLEVATNIPASNTYGLVVQNGMINAGDGLQIESRTITDPADDSNRDGQVWLRTDISSANFGDYSESGLSFDIGASVLRAPADVKDSYFKIAKNNTVYNIALVDLGNDRESKVRIETPVGTKALMNGFCGNKNKEALTPMGTTLEECDDGDTTNGNGCSNDCKCDKVWDFGPAPVCPSCGVPVAYTTSGTVTCSIVDDGHQCCEKPMPGPLTNTCEVKAPCETCSDGSQNQDETGVDCGGVCPAC